jgi:hypothetical protein
MQYSANLRVTALRRIVKNKVTKIKNMKKQTSENESISLKKLNKPTVKKRIASAHAHVTKKLKTKPHPGRDEHGKFIIGHGGHHHHKKFNWHLATGIIAIVAITGGLLVFRSFAASKAVNPKDSIAVVSCGYKTFVNRVPEAPGLKFWSERYTASNYNASALASGLLNSKEGQLVAYTTTFDSFISRLYTSCLGRAAKSDEIKAWTNAHLKGTSRQSIFNFVIQVGNMPPIKITDEVCKKFNQTGSSVKPLCKVNSIGTTRDVSIVNLPESNIYLNKAWESNFAKFKMEAAKNRYFLEANDEQSVVNALKKAYPNGRTPSPGSFRSWDEQNWLWKSPNFSANQPGKSMHEWGLAVDLKCNGSSIINNNACWQWVRNNGVRYGIYNFHTVRRITDSEAWHFSSNGR